MLQLFLVYQVEIAEQNTMKRIALGFGVVSVLLGGLWLLQGLGVVHVRPILCFADCAPIEGASQTWLIVGFLMLTVGVIAILFWLKRRTAAKTQFH